MGHMGHGTLYLMIITREEHAMKKLITAGSLPNHDPRKTMTYKELYRLVIKPGEDFQVNELYPTTEDKITGLAQFIYSYGYEDDRYMSKEDAFWTACELYEDMTGRYFDPTQEEYDGIIDKISG